MAVRVPLFTIRQSRLRGCRVRGIGLECFVYTVPYGAQERGLKRWVIPVDSYRVFRKQKQRNCPFISYDRTVEYEAVT